MKHLVSWKTFEGDSFSLELDSFRKARNFYFELLRSINVDIDSIMVSKVV